MPEEESALMMQCLVNVMGPGGDHSSYLLIAPRTLDEARITELNKDFEALGFAPLLACFSAADQLRQDEAVQLLHDQRVRNEQRKLAAAIGRTLGRGISWFAAK